MSETSKHVIVTEETDENGHVFFTFTTPTDWLVQLVRPIDADECDLLAEFTLHGGEELVFTAPLEPEEIARKLHGNGVGDVS